MHWRGLGVAAVGLLTFALSAPAASAEQLVYSKTVPAANCPFQNTTCYEVWIANADGTGARLLVPLTHAPALSADGQLVAVSDQEQRKLYVASADGTIRETYSNLPGDFARNPRFSPDGQTLIYQGATLIQDIYSISRGSTTPTLLVGWNGDEAFPTFSPNGSKIAFQSNATPTSSPSQLNAGAIWIANSNGTNPVRVTPTSISGPSSPKFSRDGQSLVFAGNKTSGSGKGPGLWIIQANGSGLRRLTSGQTDTSPDWSSDGSKIVFDRGGDGIYEINPDGTGLHEIINDTSAHDPSYRQPRTVIDYNALLQQYAPQVRYDNQENYYADSAAEITDNPLNYLRRWDGTPIAASSDPAYPQLSLSFLGSPTYSNGTVAVDNDYLDEVNDTYAVDAQNMHANAFYADRVYGHVTQSGGKTWLQYWLFYYYNDLAAEPLNTGLHEGDWEMIQVGLDSNGAPDVAAYSQHTGGELCSWNFVEKSWIASGVVGRYAPVVYAARKSHASYFHSAVYTRGVLPDDYATGNGYAAAPGLVTINDTSPGWVSWAGKWGGSDSSPVGPRYNSGDGQVKWQNPTEWASSPGVSVCGSNESSPAMSLASGVPAPEISVRQVGDSAIFRYHFARWPAKPAKRPRYLLLTVDSAGKSPSGQSYTPLSYTYRIKRQRGRKIQPLGLGGGPYRFRAAALDKDGTTSHIVRGPLR
jgi:WD40 repeat protein/VPS62-like protein